MEVPEAVENFEKLIRALEFLGVTTLAVLTYVVGRWHRHVENSPRTKIAALEKRCDDFAILIGEVTKNVASNSGNIDDLTEQISAIQGDNETKIARLVLRSDLEPLFHDIQVLDDRLFDMATGRTVKDRRLSTTKQQRRNDPRN